MVVCAGIASLPLGNLGGRPDVVRHAMRLDWACRSLDLLVGYSHYYIGDHAADLLVLCVGD